FDLAVVEGDEDDRYAVLRQRRRLAHPGAERIAIHRGRRSQIGYGNGDMIETSKHFGNPCSQRVTNTVTIGFLPQASRAADRTARRADSATASRSLRRCR